MNMVIIIPFFNGELKNGARLLVDFQKNVWSQTVTAIKLRNNYIGIQTEKIWIMPFRIKHFQI